MIYLTRALVHLSAWDVFKSSRILFIWMILVNYFSNAFTACEQFEKYIIPAV